MYAHRKCYRQCDCVYLYYVVSPIFLPSTDFHEDNSSVTFIKIADPETYSMFCSYIDFTKVAVSCKVLGIPLPSISIYRVDTNGKKRMFPPTFQKDSEIIVVLPLEYGESVLLQCVASNIVSTVTLSINLTYTCKYI